MHPNYSITNKLLNHLTAITSAREVIEQSRLLPQREATLRRQALLHNTHSSTAIEGNLLNYDQVVSLANGTSIAATHKDKQEVLNYINALEHIPELIINRTFSAETLLQLHRRVSTNVLQTTSDSGAYRKVQVFVGRSVFTGTHVHQEVDYMPPTAKEVPILVNEFISWLNKKDSWEIHPVLLAGIAHYEIARIHPFIDGNGRTARLFASLVLYESGFDKRRLFALDDYYDHDRQAYYNALKTVDSETWNITRWLEYFCEGVLFAIEKVKSAVIKTGGKSTKTNKPQIILSQRHMQMVEFIIKHGKASNKDFQELFAISAQSVHKDLTALVEAEVLVLHGKGRAAHYIVVDD
jgi:Fic family protein